MKRKKIITVSVVFFGLVSLVTISALFKQSTALVSDAAAPPASDTSSLQIHPPAAGIVAEIKAGQNGIFYSAITSGECLTYRATRR